MRAAAVDGQEAASLLADQVEVLFRKLGHRTGREILDRTGFDRTAELSLQAARTQEHESGCTGLHDSQSSQRSQANAQEIAPGER